MPHSTADLCDAHGDDARVIAGLELRFGRRLRFSGPAFPIILYGPDGTLAEILRTPGAGRVAVVAVHHPDGKAVFGEGMARNAEANGWAGVLIDGAARDVATFGERDIGIAARTTHPAIVRSGTAGQIAEHVAISRVDVSRNDTIFCDEDGIVAIATARL